MTLTPKHLAISAMALTVAFAFVGGLGGGVDFASGVAVSGALMLLNLWGWGVVVGRAIEAARSGRALPWVVLLFVLKLNLLVAGVLLVAALFPPLSVLLGSSVVVGAVMMWAVVAAFTELQVGEA